MTRKSIKPLGIFGSFIYFSIPTLLLFIATIYCIPVLHKSSNLPLVVCWHICSSLLVFILLFIAALVLYRLEGNPWHLSAFLKRYRLNNLNRKVWIISITGTVSISLLVYISMNVGKLLVKDFSGQPAFMTMQPLQDGEYWILLVWLPMFFFNIMGEGLFWRGYIFPRQELKFGKTTWLVHGLCWTFFHLPFGWDLLFSFLPILFITAYLVQLTRSTWTDIIIHTIINGSGFLLIAFGIVS
jgi:membrane protease YdiL (CAAX protease family)